MVQPVIGKEKESSVSPTGSTMMTGLQWGHETMQEAANVGRCIGDGILLRVLASVHGRQLTALVDSGTS